MSIKNLCPVLLTLAALLSACASDAEPPEAERAVDQQVDRDVRLASDSTSAQPPATPSPAEVAIPRPLVGPLRVVDKRFHDNTGPRRVFFSSAFPLLRVYHDDPARGDAIIDSIARAGYQGVRVFAYLGMYANHPNTPEYTKDYYHGAEVSLDVAKATIVPLAKALHARGLRLQLSGDNHWLVPDEALVQHWAALADALHGAGLDETVAYIDVINEYFLAKFENEQQVAFSRRVMETVKSRLSPAPLMSQGSLNSEAAADLDRSSQVGEVTDIHGTRQPWDEAIERALGLVYQNGNYRSFKLPFWQGEPTGPGAYLPQDNPNALFGLYAAHALSGQASVYFCGATVKLDAPLESCWGFNELPRLLSHIPEDISTWGHGPGGGYWWSDGRRFATLDVENWGTEQRAAVADWTIVTVNDVTKGTGEIPRPARGYMVRLIVGTYEK